MQYLVISALGGDRSGIVNDLTGVVVESGCNIVDSRMTIMGGDFAVLMLVEGQWNAVAKLEGQIPALQERLGMAIIAKRTETAPAQSNGLPYTVEVISLDHPGIVYQLAGFFASRGINIQELETDSYRAPHTGTPMFMASMTVSIPTDTHIASLREEFLDFCDTLNLDAVLEPVKR